MRYTGNQAAGVKVSVVRMQPETSTSKESDDEAKRRERKKPPEFINKPRCFFIQRIQIDPIWSRCWFKETIVSRLLASCIYIYIYIIILMHLNLVIYNLELYIISSYYVNHSFHDLGKWPILLEKPRIQEFWCKLSPSGVKPE